MAYEPAPLISRDVPRRRRRQRRAQQQSSCCCGAIVGVCLIIALIAWRGPIFSIFKRDRADTTKVGAPAFPLALNTDAQTYLRYNLVRLSATFTNAQAKQGKAAEAPEIVVTKDGEVVTTIGDFESVTPTYDQNARTYQACWPVPWNCPAGEYIAEARVAITDPGSWVWETEQQRREKRKERRRNEQPEPPVSGTAFCVSRVRFIITGHAPNPNIPPGTCVATWESDFPAGRLRRPDGTMGDWKVMFDWCEFMGADTLWFRGGITEAYKSTPLTLEHPFKQMDLDAVPKLAAEAHHRGLRFGTWACGYSSYPRKSNQYKPEYDYAQDVSRGSGAIRSLDFISLLDRRRITHLAKFFADMQADPNVDYLGLDYMRSDRGSYEITDRFAREMPLRLPANFFSRSRAARYGYVAGKIESEWQKDPDFYDAWNWWRAHTGAEAVRDMIAGAQLKKPLWVFVLSWWHGKQHGQDPLMFTDAGVSLLAPMLYQVDNRAMFDTMVRDWNEYLAAGQANVCPGDQIDFYWHQKLTTPPAPYEMYDRLITAHGARGKGYLQGGYTVGAFAHDINRCLDGVNDGPYPGTEWALAAGAAFTTVRTSWGVFPLRATLKLPATAPLNTTVQGELTLENVTKKSVDRITVQLVKTEGVELAGPLESVSVRGSDRVIKKIPVRLKPGHSDRGNRVMVCVRIKWQEGDYPEPVRKDLPRMMLVMDYIRGK
jgi:hypothetical protein